MHYARKLSTHFLQDLKVGLLTGLLTRIREDQTLMLAIRSDFINIYYRGGNLFRISRSASGVGYKVDFDTNYLSGFPDSPPAYPHALTIPEHASELVRSIPNLKYVMDRFFAIHNKAEREFQQLVVRENNSSSISNETDYFVVDIEIAGVLPDARYDMLAVRWLSHEHGKPGTLVPVLIEMKYGIHALGGKSGLSQHVEDAYSLVGNKSAWAAVVDGMEEQLAQLDELDLLAFTRSKRVPQLRVDRNATPELIFLLANYNPASVQLLRFLEEAQSTQIEKAGFDLLFFVSCFSGYGMHRESMLNIHEFTVEVRRLYELATEKRKTLSIG